MDAQLRNPLLVSQVFAVPDRDSAVNEIQSNYCGKCENLIKIRLAIVKIISQGDGRFTSILPEDVGLVIYLLITYITLISKQKSGSNCNCVSRMLFAWQVIAKPEPDPAVKIFSDSNLSFDLSVCRLLLGQCIYQRATSLTDLPQILKLFSYAIAVLRTAESSFPPESESKLLTGSFLRLMHSYIATQMLLLVIDRKIMNVRPADQAHEILGSLALRASTIMNESYQVALKTKLFHANDQIMQYSNWAYKKARTIYLYFAARQCYISPTEQPKRSFPKCGEAVAILYEARSEAKVSWTFTIPSEIKRDSEVLSQFIDGEYAKVNSDNSKICGQSIPKFSDLTLPAINEPSIQPVMRGLLLDENLQQICDLFKQFESVQISVDIPASSSASSKSAQNLPYPTSLSGISKPMQFPVADKAGIVALDLWNNRHLASLLRRVSFPIMFTLSNEMYILAKNDETRHLTGWMQQLQSALDLIIKLKKQISERLPIVNRRQDWSYAYNSALIADELLIKTAADMQSNLRFYLEKTPNFQISKDANHFHALFFQLEANDAAVLPQLQTLYAETRDIKQTLVEEFAVCLSNSRTAVEFYTGFMQTLSVQPTKVS